LSKVSRNNFIKLNIQSANTSGSVILLSILEAGGLFGFWCRLKELKNELIYHGYWCSKIEIPPTNLRPLSNTLFREKV